MAFTEAVLVNKRDGRVGRMEKLQAHREGPLHRAVTAAQADIKARAARYTPWFKLTLSAIPAHAAESMRLERAG